MLPRTSREELEDFIGRRIVKGLNRSPLIGLASADDPHFSGLRKIVGPHHRLPRDFLPEARTVVSFFLPFTFEVVQSNRGPETSELWARAYVETNTAINAMSRELAGVLESRGLKAATVPATHNFDEQTLTSPWSHRSAAVIAGLGRFGLNRLLITPKGAAGRLGTFFLSEYLTADPRLEAELCLHFKDGSSCGYCRDHCPTGVLGRDAFDRRQCYRHLLEVAEAFQEIGLCDVCGKCSVGPCGALGREE